MGGESLPASLRDGFPLGTTAHIYTKVVILQPTSLAGGSGHTGVASCPGSWDRGVRCSAPPSISCAEIPTSRLRHLLPGHTLALNLPPCSRRSQRPICDTLVLLGVLSRLHTPTPGFLVFKELEKKRQRPSIILFKKAVKGLQGLLYYSEHRHSSQICSRMCLATKGALPRVAKGGVTYGIV